MTMSGEGPPKEPVAAERGRCGKTSFGSVLREAVMLKAVRDLRVANPSRGASGENRPLNPSGVGSQ